MTRQEIVARLKGLRQAIEIESDSELTIRDIECTMNYVLLDVCQALGLSQTEQDEVLGYNTKAAAAERVWWPVPAAAWQ